MSNIWEFLLQTFSVSAVALLILILKKLLEDKLSPRWQYGIWIILLLRMIIPVHVSKSVLLSIPLWIEMMKGTFELQLNSNLTRPFYPSDLGHVLPIIQDLPNSITDYLFFIYIIGILGWACFYGWTYIKLKKKVTLGKKVELDILKEVEAKYHLKSCDTYLLDDISTPFILGVFRPVLVIPKGKDIDEKVLVHELLHLKYKDGIQNIIWCIFRCLHWCNPFIHYVMNSISNDMEALCDWRVLELLDGEQRRQYGYILLDMANNKYSRTPGTTSISNGGKNISKRIKYIARFKKYPKGMMLVSICSIIILLSPTLIGTSHALNSNFYPNSQDELMESMAASRIQRCSSIAGAIYTYSQGLVYENGIYLATASPLALQEKIYTQMTTKPNEFDWVHHYETDYESIDPTIAKYTIYNILKNQDGTYDALLALKGITTNDGIEHFEKTYFVPLLISKENGSWVVEERGEWIISDVPYDLLHWSYFPYEELKSWEELNWTYKNSDHIIKNQYALNNGKINVNRLITYDIDNQVTNIDNQATNTFSDIFGNEYSNINQAPVLDATFSNIHEYLHITYTFDKPPSQEDIVYIKIQTYLNGEPLVNYSTDESVEAENGSISMTHHNNVYKNEDTSGYSYKIKINVNGKVIEEYFIEGGIDL